MSSCVMRASLLATIATVTIIIGAAGRAEALSVTQLPYPEDVSLVQDAKGWTFRQNLSSLPLYLYEPKKHGNTACNQACEVQWMPLLVQAGEKALGAWTIVMRPDGQRQWAFEQHPVYTHLNDTPNHIGGDGVDGIWHLLPHFST